MKILLAPRSSGRENMDADLKLFHDLESGCGCPTLRIYSWEPKCISLGYSQKIAEEIDSEKARCLGWDVVKRPTGGGIVFHNEAEVTYSLVMEKDDDRLPKGLVPSYKKISEALVAALSVLGIGSEVVNITAGTRRSSLCFSYLAEYEVVSGGKKIIGSAQKRGRKALLQQGSIFVRRTLEADLSVLKDRRDKPDAVSIEEITGREIGFQEFSRALLRGFEKELGIKVL